MVDGAYTAYSKKEAEWDSFLGVARVTGRLEKVLMFVSGFYVQICVDWLLLRCTCTSTGGPSSLCEFKMAVNIKDLYGNSGKRFKSINTR